MQGRDGLLLSAGKSRGTVYFLLGETLPTPEQVFVGPTILSSVIGNMGSSSEYLSDSSEYLTESSKHITPETHHQLEAKTEASRDGYGRLLSPLFDAPIIDDIAVLDEGFRLLLEKLADELRTKAKLGQQQMERVLLTLCRDQFLTLSLSIFG